MFIKHLPERKRVGRCSELLKGWEAATHLAEKFRTGPTRKEYLALVDGKFPEGEVVSRKPIDRYKLTAKVRDENYSEIIDCVGVERNEQLAGGGDHIQVVAVLP